MEQAKFKIAISNIVAEVDRRCFGLTHPVPDGISEVRQELWVMKEIIDNAIMALNFEEDGVSHLEKVEAWIKQRRIQEYEDEKAGEERKKIC